MLIILLQIFTSILSGDFHTSTNWSPQPNTSNYNNGGSTFIISAGHVMTTSARLSSVKLVVYGSLIINDDRFTVADSIIMYPGSALTADPALTIDLSGVVIQSFGDVTVDNNIVNYTSPTLPLILKYLYFKPPRNIIWQTLVEQDVYEYQVYLDDRCVISVPGSVNSYTPRSYEVRIPDSYTGQFRLTLYEVNLHSRRRTVLTKTIHIPDNQNTSPIGLYDLLGRYIAKYPGQNISPGVYIMVYRRGDGTPYPQKLIIR